MDDEFKFDDIAGQPATLTINARDTYCVITWGDITISETFGEIGFWTSFHKKPESYSHGAAREAALKKHAKATIEFEIYFSFKCMKEELTESQE